MWDDERRSGFSLCGPLDGGTHDGIEGPRFSAIFSGCVSGSAYTRQSLRTLCPHTVKIASPEREVARLRLCFAGR